MTRKATLMEPGILESDATASAQYVLEVLDGIYSKKNQARRANMATVNELGQSFQVRRTGAAADQRHERRDIIDIPEAATPPKGLGSGHEGIQDHCQFELGNF